MGDRIQLSFKEEVANAITHGVMSIIALIALPIGAVYAYQQQGASFAFGISVFIISLFLMFLSSTLYHSMDFNSKQKAIFQKIDHIMIFVAIAGSYTPIAISLIGGWQGALILVIQWLMVLIGIFYKVFSKRYIPKLSLFLYLTMGWIALLFLPTLIANGSWMFFGLILAGGIFYSVGAYFYMKRSMTFHHMIWHLFINFAAVFHFVAIVWFIF
ncbi:MAG: PAQR family membrane homeostasis protein TrhA [Erysipelotrichaceae bacterium]